MITLIALAALAQMTIDQRVDSLLKQMTLEEKVSLCHGGTDFGTKAIPRLGIPEFRFTDGPNGVRDQEMWPSTGFPTGVAMAATWDPGLLHRIGGAIAQEAKGLGKSVQLGPAINIDRTPLGGRTFEYYSEDPFLASRLAVEWIKGLQSNDVVACVKHYAANSVENDRGEVDAQVDERTLREIYLPAFEASINEGKSGSIMSAYNKVNGHFSSENKHLLLDILKGEWKFRGFVMSDWGAVHSTVPTAINGLDLEMPGGKNNYLADPLVAAVKSGEVPEAVVDDKVRRILRTLLPHETAPVKKDPHVSNRERQALAQHVAEDGMVLLKNEKGLLPVQLKDVKTIAVIGPNADAKHEILGGSGGVVTPFEVTPLQGIRERFGKKVKITYSPGYDARAQHGDIITSDFLQTEDGKPGLEGAYYANQEFTGDPAFKRVDARVDFNWNKLPPREGFRREYFSVIWNGYLTPRETELYEISTSSDDGSMVTIDGNKIVDNWGGHAVQQRSGLIHLEGGHKYKIEVKFFQGYGDGEMHLTWEKASYRESRPWIEDAVKAAKEADLVLFIGGINHGYDTEGADKPDMKVIGDQDTLIEQVCAANPKTVLVLINGTPVEMPWIDKVHSVLEAWYPGLMGGHAIARVLAGDVNPSGKLPLTFPKRLEDSPSHANGNYPPKNHVIRYDEGLLVGYRYYDTKQVEPLFPFGYGISYTTFGYSNLRTRRHEGVVDVMVDLTNTGAVRGADTVQVYVHQRNAKVMRPEQELKGFQKVWLNPGETKRVTIRLDRRAFAYWSEEIHDWVVDGGTYDLRVGCSSRHIQMNATTDYQ